MRVAITLASAPGQLSGVQRHALNAARSLLTQDAIEQVHLIAAPWQVKFVLDNLPSADNRLKLHTPEIGTSAVARNLWFLHGLPRIANQLGVDLLHLSYPVPLRAWSFACPVVVTLHDLYPFDIPRNFGYPRVWMNRVVLRNCLSSADAIACVSQHTLNRLEQLNPLLALAKATVIENCVEPFSSPLMAVSAINSLRAPFLLCVAQHRHNKNLDTLLNAFELLDSREPSSNDRIHLVIVGSRGPETNHLLSLQRGLKSARRIHFLEGLSEAQLHWCYHHCQLLVAPSLDEGFGLPVAEALLHGCPVLCSDIPAHRRVGADACRYVSLGDRDNLRLTQAIDEALSLKRQGSTSLPHLSARVIGRQYLQLYSGLLTPRVSATSTVNCVASDTPHRRSIA